MYNACTRSVLSDADKRWLGLVIQRPVTQSDMNVVGMYLKQGRSLKEIARMFVESKSR